MPRSRSSRFPKHRLVTISAAALLLFPTGVPAFLPFIPILIGGAARALPRVVPQIGRAIGRGAGRELRDRLQDEAETRVGCSVGLFGDAECEEFRKRDLMEEEKREVGEGVHLEVVDASEDHFWNSCLGQTSMNGRPELEWQGDGSLMLKGLQPACMEDVQWWNGLPEIGELEEAYGKVVELEEGKVHWTGLPDEEYAMLKGVTDMWKGEGWDNRGPPTEESKHENKEQGKPKPPKQGGQEHNNEQGWQHDKKRDGWNQNGEYHRSWQA